jgi:hypothetical protein
MSDSAVSRQVSPPSAFPRTRWTWRGADFTFIFLYIYYMDMENYIQYIYNHLSKTEFGLNGKIILSENVSGPVNTEWKSKITSNMRKLLNVETKLKYNNLTEKVFRNI